MQKYNKSIIIFSSHDFKDSHARPAKTDKVSETHFFPLNPPLPPHHTSNFPLQKQPLSLALPLSFLQHLQPPIQPHHSQHATNPQPNPPRFQCRPFNPAPQWNILHRNQHLRMVSRCSDTQFHGLGQLDPSHPSPLPRLAIRHARQP
jgi:hypothetical protein